jgi:hypothetical protein
LHTLPAPALTLGETAGGERGRGPDVDDGRTAQPLLDHV